MKMKRAVILCLSILLSVTLLVKCDPTDDGSSDTDPDEYNMFDETEFQTTEGELDGDEGRVNEGYSDGDADEEANLKCFVCRAVIEVMLYEVEKVDPRKRIELTSTKSIQYSKSEAYLAELMEDLCEYEDTFATIRQVVVQKSIIKRMLENDGAVEDTPYFTSESDLTERVNHLCLEVLEENEDVILQEFKKEVTLDNIDEIVCRQSAQYCDKDGTGDTTNRDEL